MKKFVIDESKWRCGGDYENEYGLGRGRTELLNAEGYMCCLGQMCKQCGVPKKDLLNIDFPSQLYTCAGYNLYVLQRKETEEQASRINDSDDLTLEERKKQLKDFFLKNCGFLISFTKGKKMVKDETFGCGKREKVMVTWRGRSLWAYVNRVIEVGKKWNAQIYANGTSFTGTLTRNSLGVYRFSYTSKN